LSLSRTTSEIISKRSAALLLLLGCASLALYRIGAGAKSADDIRWFLKVALVQSALYLLASFIILRSRSSRVTLLLTILFAVLFRLSILFSPPYLSDDIYRYIWDGRVQAAGINPFRYIPAAPELAHLRDDAIYPRINRRDYAHTIYPPVTQIIFLLTTRISESVTWMKFTMVVFEAIAVWAIVQLLASFGLARERILLYAWHPLVIWEFAGSGHADAIAIAFIALAFLAWRRNAHLGAGVALACATLTKLIPVVLFPALLRRRRWKVIVAFVATIIVGYLGYLSVGLVGAMGSLPVYSSEQGLMTGKQYYLLNVARKLFGANVSPFVYICAGMLVMAAIALWVLLRKPRPEDKLEAPVALATGTTVLFAPHYSWYFTWLIPFLCFTPSLWMFYLTIASFLLYRTWLGDSPDDMLLLNSSIYLPTLLIALIEFIWRRRKISRS
jgi:alpha-1,6-mannosyltransferase